MLDNNFENKISNEQTASLSAMQFEGRVQVVDSVKDVEAACADLSKYSVIGFDTETRPSFRAGVSNKVALLQLSTPTTCYLFRLCRMPLERAIIKVLESPNIIKIGADVAGDIKALKALRHFKNRGFVDLQSIISEWGVEEKSLRKMAAIVMGHKISKAQRLSNWEAQRMTEPQKIYAATDAWACIMIYERLMQTSKK